MTRGLITLSTHLKLPGKKSLDLRSRVTGRAFYPVRRPAGENDAIQ